MFNQVAVRGMPGRRCWWEFIFPRRKSRGALPRDRWRGRRGLAPSGSAPRKGVCLKAIKGFTMATSHSGLPSAILNYTRVCRPNLRSDNVGAPDHLGAPFPCPPPSSPLPSPKRASQALDPVPGLHGGESLDTLTGYFDLSLLPRSGGAFLCQ